MKRNIVKISSFSHAIPKYKTWYQYYGIVWVSVICSENNRRSHLRRYTRPELDSSKKDNEMCQWHSDWQFQKIENHYGSDTVENKTFEISINYENEVHRIDSVVDNIAIEFQHTISVSINEMNSRYNAHKASGYVPYLILDFTEFNASETIDRVGHFSFDSILVLIDREDKETVLSFLRKIRKWGNSKYFFKGNLFLDFKDKMIRFTPQLKKKYINLTQDEFIKELTALEDKIKQLKTEELEQEKREKEESERIKLIEIQERDECKKSLYIEKVRQNQYDLKYHADFKYYRKCLQNKVIKQAILKIPYIETVKYSSHIEIEKGIYKKYHIYSIFQSVSDKPVIELSFITNSKKIGNKFEYLFSEIELIKEFENGLKTFYFIQERGNDRIKLKFKKLELVRGYYHSIDKPALYKFDDNEKLVSQDYYLFNYEVSEKDFSDIAQSFDPITHSIIELTYEQDNIVKSIQESDSYNFIECFIQDYFHYQTINNYYIDLGIRKPLSETNEL